MPDFTIKGNPGEIRSRGQTCADKGKFFDQTGDALTKIDTQGWIGRAADNFRDAHDREPNRWYEAGTGFRATGNALIDYAAALETAQQNAATAKSEYERGEGVTTQAKSDYTEYSSRFDRARSDALAGGMTYPYTKDPFTDPGAEIRSSALEMFETAKSDLKIAAGRCAREVRVGCKDAPEKRNWFESGLAFVGGIFEGAGEAVWDLVKMGYNMGPLHDIIEFATGDLTAEELAAQKSMMLEDAEALWQALKADPLEFGKQLGKGLLDWDTWADDPARAIGHLVPDIVAGVLTGGTGTVATRGIKGGADALDALGDMTKALRGVDNLDGLGDVGKIDNAIDDLGDLGKLDDVGDGSKVDSPLTDAQRDEILEIEKGDRPDPSTYLPPEYIEQHLGKFDDGATRFMTETNLDKYGIAQRDGTSYVMPKSEVDALFEKTGGDPRAMEDALGLPEGFFDSGVVRVDIPDARDHGLRMPSGNEAGANDQWLPGGQLPTGLSEAVIDGGDIASDGYRVTPVK